MRRWCDEGRCGLLLPLELGVSVWGKRCDVLECRVEEGATLCKSKLQKSFIFPFTSYQ